MMKRRYQIAIAAVFCAIAIVYLCRSYYIEAWGTWYYSYRDGRRYEQLRTLYTALEEYRQKAGVWPADLDAVRERYLELLHPMRPWEVNQSPEEVKEEDKPFVGFPPLTGSHRVVYYNPPLGGKLILRSYGHLEETPGWNLRREPVTMDFDVRGEMVFHPIGRESGLQSGTEP